MRGERIELYPSSDGWRWRWKAGNNEIIAQGESHPSEDGARRAAERVRENSPEVPIYEVEE